MSVAPTLLVMNRPKIRACANSCYLHDDSG